VDGQSFAHIGLDKTDAASDCFAHKMALHWYKRLTMSPVIKFIK
jgi:hypothetical protein